jgi:hypothetical protein
MSRLVSRILLSILMFPLAGIVYMFTVVVGEYTFARAMSWPYQEIFEFKMAGTLTWFVIGVYWSLLWMNSVRWTTARIVGTLLSVIVSLGAGVSSALITSAVIHGTTASNSFGTFIGSMVVIVSWLIATVFLWRETAAERSQRVKTSSKSAITCPTCGYNLTGLSEARCPECGSKFTLDELIGLQSAAETTEIE